MRFKHIRLKKGQCISDFWILEWEEVVGGSISTISSGSGSWCEVLCMRKETMEGQLSH